MHQDHETGHQYAMRIDALASALLRKTDELMLDTPCSDYAMQEALLLASVRYLGVFAFSAALERLMPSSKPLPSSASLEDAA